MPDTYEVKAPDGSTIEIQSDGPPSPASALRAIRAYGDQQAAKAQSKAEAGASFTGTVLKPMARGVLRTLPGVGAIVGGVLSAPESLGAATIPGMALGAGVGRGAEDLIAQATGLDAPTTPTDKALGIAKDTAETGATAAILPGLVAAAKSPIQTLREGAEQFGSAMPQSVRKLGKLFPSLPTPPARIPEAEFSAPPTGPTIQGVPVDDLRAAGVGESSIQKTLGGTLRMAPSEAPMRPVASHPPSVAPMQPVASHAPSAPPSPLQQPRVDVGAEVVGRQNGLTTDAVRQQTGPILGEEPGSASPILPEKALQRIVDTLRAMPPGSPDREAYVRAATSGKAQWQIENIRRTLEHLGLLVPIAAGATAATSGAPRASVP